MQMAPRISNSVQEFKLYERSMNEVSFRKPEHYLDVLKTPLWTEHIQITET